MTLEDGHEIDEILLDIDQLIRAVPHSVIPDKNSTPDAPSRLFRCSRLQVRFSLPSDDVTESSYDKTIALDPEALSITALCFLEATCWHTRSIS